MLKPSLDVCSVLTIALLLACSSSKTDGFVGSGVKAPSGTSSSSGSVGGKKGSGITVPITQTGAGSTTSSDTSASMGSTPSTPVGIGGSGSQEGGAEGGDSGEQEVPPGTAGTGETYDPPTGETKDPPDAGQTGDPPVGQTGDPPVGQTGDPPTGDTGDPPTGNTGDPPEGCTMTEIDKVNVIVFGDATPSGADVEGRMWVGGNATFDGYAVGSSSAAGAAPKSCDTDEYSLVVGGDLSGQVNAGKGLVAVYGKNAAKNITSCGVTKEHPVDFDELEKKLKGYSAAFRDYPANGTAETANGALVLSGTNTELNVFSITAAQLRVGTIKIAVPKNSSVVVNVSGTDVLWNGAGFTLPDGASCRGGTSDWCHRIMWNFYEAKTLELGGIGVQGSVTAPYAKISGGGGNIDGQLIAAELTGGIEYHPYFFSGCLLLPKKP